MDSMKIAMKSIMPNNIPLVIEKMIDEYLYKFTIEVDGKIIEVENENELMQHLKKGEDRRCRQYGPGGHYWQFDQYNIYREYDLDEPDDVVILPVTKICVNKGVFIITSAYRGLFKNLTGIYVKCGIVEMKGDMTEMFENAEHLVYLPPLKTSEVTGMKAMFNGAKAFNQSLELDTSNVSDMSYMFCNAIAFDKPLTFDTQNVKSMCGMFSGATAFNQRLEFKTPNLKSTDSMFHRAINFNQPLFDLSNVSNTDMMFFGAVAFDQDVPFDTSDMEKMSYIFNGATAFKKRMKFDMLNLPRNVMPF